MIGWRSTYAIYRNELARFVEVVRGRAEALARLTLQR